MHLSRSNRAFLLQLPSAILLVALVLPTTPLAAQDEAVQIEAAQATDNRFLSFVSLFQETIVKVWGDDAKIGRLDASESRILANIHVGDELHGVEFTARRLKDDKKFELREAEGSKEHLLALSVLDETRLRPLIEATHAQPGGATAHLFKIEMAYFPNPVNRSVALVQMIGISARIAATFDLDTGDPFDLGALLPNPAHAPVAPPITRRPRGGLREWMAGWEEAIAALEKSAGAPLHARRVRFLSTGIEMTLADGDSFTSYAFDNQGLRKISSEDATAPTAPCQEPFDPRSVRLDRLAELADRALETTALPYQDLVDARVERGPDCAAPEIRFLIRSPQTTSEVAFNQEGEPIATEAR